MQGNRGPSPQTINVLRALVPAKASRAAGSRFQFTVDVDDVDECARS